LRDACSYRQRKACDCESRLRHRIDPIEITEWRGVVRLGERDGARCGPAADRDGTDEIRTGDNGTGRGTATCRHGRRSAAADDVIAERHDDRAGRLLRAATRLLRVRQVQRAKDACQRDQAECKIAIPLPFRHAIPTFCASIGQRAPTM
jgi:hypothetical protein